MTTSSFDDGVSLETLLSAETDGERCFGRLCASKANEEFNDFIEAELERGTSASGLMAAVTSWVVSQHASLAAYFMEEGGYEKTAAAFQKHIADEYVGIATACHERIIAASKNEALNDSH